MTHSDTTLYGAFRNGVNLGGWLSQFDIDMPARFSPRERLEHFETFITRDDIARVAGWGFDHVRLPVDGIVLTEAGPRTGLDPMLMDYVDRCLDWCAEQDLNVVLDLHDFHGNVWGAMTDLMPLLSDPALADFFVETWEQLAAHLRTRRAPIVMLELLNEVSDASGVAWNALVARTVSAVRAVDPARWILVGSNGQNGVDHLAELRLPAVPGVFATFHYYEPQAFTHQRAHFSPEHREFGQPLSYPGDLRAFATFVQSRPEYAVKHHLALHETRNDHELMERLLSRAGAFTAGTGVGLYCGEFGVIDSADEADAARWVADLVEWADRHHVGRAVWTYKERDFGLVRDDGSVRSELVLAALGAVPRRDATSTRGD